VNVTCFTEAVIRAHLDKAVAQHVATDVSAVIAAKQEAPSIADIVNRTRRYAGEVFVVDGHSTDGTPELAARCGASVLADGGRGKGDAIRRAIPHIRTPVTVFLDADGSHDPEDIPLLVEPILTGQADHVTASRLRGGSSELHGGFDEFFRLAGSSFITACINRRFNCRLSDSQNGFRAIRTTVLRQLDLRENVTTIEQEMIIKTLRRGLRIAEVPSHEHPRLHGRSHICVWRSAPRYGFSLVKYLFF
jgi:dolichol-phosphate mannosyltransferase